MSPTRSCSYSHWFYWVVGTRVWFAMLFGWAIDVPRRHVLALWSSEEFSLVFLLKLDHSLVPLLPITPFLINALLIKVPEVDADAHSILGWEKPKKPRFLGALGSKEIGPSPWTWELLITLFLPLCIASIWALVFQVLSHSYPKSCSLLSNVTTLPHPKSNQLWKMWYHHYICFCFNPHFLEAKSLRVFCFCFPQ